MVTGINVYAAIIVQRPGIIAVYASLILSGYSEVVIMLYKEYASMILVIC